MALALLGPRSATAIEAPGVRSLYLLSIPFLHFGPLRPEGGADLDLTIAYGNTFSHSWHPNAIKLEFGTQGRPFLRSEAEELHLRHPQDTIFFVDGDVTRIALFAALPIGRGFAVGLEVPWVSFSALHLDSAVDGFHRAFGIPESQRQWFPKRRFQIVLQSPGGPLVYFDCAPGAGLSDIVTTLRWRGEMAGRWHFAADLALKLPTGNADELRGSGSIDGGLLLGIWKSFGSSERWTLLAEGSVVVPGPYRGSLPLPLDPATFFRGLFGLQFRIGSGTFVSLAGVRQQSALHRQDLGDVTAASGEVSLGLAQRLFGHGMVELSITENVPRLGDAPDLVAAFRLRWEIPE